MTWASAPADAAAVARDVSDRADGVSGLVDPALPAHVPTGAVAAGDRRSVKRGCAHKMSWRLIGCSAGGRPNPVRMGEESLKPGPYLKCGRVLDGASPVRSAIDLISTDQIQADECR